MARKVDEGYADEPFAKNSIEAPVPPAKSRIRAGTPEFVAYLRSLRPRDRADGSDDRHIPFNHPKIGKP